MRKLAQAALLNVEAFTETAWRRFANRLGFSQVRQIVAYIAYGNDKQVWVRGRVLANRPIRGPEAGDGWWDNLRATYERWETDEVAGAEVELTYGTQRRVVTTDEEGYYVAAFDRDASCPSSQVVIARSQSKDATMAAQHQVMSIRTMTRPTMPRWAQFSKATPTVANRCEEGGDSTAFARHMHRIGLLPRSVHQPIAASVERDHQRD